MSTRPLVLLSNDDGYFSRGIRALRESISAFADVIVVAPESEQSASSHALSLHKPLRMRRVEEGIFALDGTPADCVYVALHSDGRALPRKPDLVVSGINHGLNLGQDVFYSGTVAAAREGALRRIPALAASAHVEADFEEVALLVARIARALLAEPVDGATPLLNVNVPKDWNGTLVTTKLGARVYEEVCDFRHDPRGRQYLWLGGPGVTHENDPGSDTNAYDDHAASLTPLLLDLTSRAHTSLAERIATAAKT